MGSEPCTGNPSGVGYRNDDDGGASRALAVVWYKVLEVVHLKHQTCKMDNKICFVLLNGM